MSVMLDPDPQSLKDLLVPFYNELEVRRYSLMRTGVVADQWLSYDSKVPFLAEAKP
jgi:hypothetical protein